MLYQIYVDARSVITLRAGEAQGITPKAIFSIFSSPDSPVPVGRLQVSRVRACSSVLKKIEDSPPFDVTPNSWAHLFKAGEGVDISVAVPLEDSFLLLFLRIVQEMESQRPEKRNILAVEPTVPHELALTAENGKAIFQLTDAGCVKAGLSRIPYTVPLTDTDGLYLVLAHAANFFFHLRRSNNGSKDPLGKLLTLEAYELKEQYLSNEPDKFSREPVLMPDSNNLCPDGAETLHAVAGDEYDETSAIYGFKLVNESTHNLYVWAFMFDMSTLSIRCIYRPPAAKVNVKALNSHAGKVVPADASLLAGGSLTIGYGSGGGSAQSFMLNEDDAVDVSYLKLFVTNQYVDLSYIQQGNPFDGSGRVSKDSKSVREVWDTVRLMIIQRRAT